MARLRVPDAKTVWRGALALVALALVAGAVVALALRFRPQPAPTLDGSRAQGTLSGPDLSGGRTYQNARLRFRVDVPSGWRLREAGASRATEGDYLTLAFIPDRASSELSPPELEVVPDPQGFPVDAIAKMKWGTGDTTLTVTTSTIEVAGSRAIEIHAASPQSAKPLFTYEAIATLAGRLYLMRYETSDQREFEAMAEQTRRIFSSIQAY